MTESKTAAVERRDGRGPDVPRPVKFLPHFIKTAEGSVLVTVGETRVICTASVENRLPKFLRDGGQGWITAEYSMIPRATDVRTSRESSRGRVSGRTHEIQRLIGRSLRTITHLPAIGERTIWIDCDVIQADGGTRTASITGAFVALVLALDHMRRNRVIHTAPLKGAVAATSVGMVGGRALLDLTYEEDCVAEVDMNVIGTDRGDYVEIQGTGERSPFTPEDLKTLLKLADRGMETLFEAQRRVLEGILLPLLRDRPGASPGS